MQAEGSSKAFEEDFPLEDLEISTNDFMAKVSLGDFRRNWDTLGADGEVLEKFALQVCTCAGCCGVSDVCVSVCFAVQTALCAPVLGGNVCWGVVKRCI
jgi:hypothetical protein